MRKITIAKLCTILVLWGITAFQIQAQVTCVNCPINGQAAGVAAGIFVTRVNGSIVLPGNPVGGCEQLVVHTDLGYKASFPGGVVGAGYFGGTAQVLAFPGNAVVPESTANVTPAALATTKIGPVPPAANACGDTDDLAMNNLTYTLTAADIAAGSVKFRFDYSGGTTLITPCNLQASGSVEFTVQIAALPTCSIAPPTQTICEGGTATFTGTATGTGPFTYAWRKGCPGVGAVLATTATLTINNAQLADAGCYELTVTDAFGCITTCQATLVVNPNPTCTVAGDSPVCPGTTHTYTSTVLPAGGTVTHSWTITGSGTINGPANGPTVSVTAGASGSFTLTDNVTRNGCPSVCTLTVPITPPPTCTVTGDSPVCENSTHTYTSTVLPAGGTVTHSWSITGNGTINGPANGATVSVTAGSSGSFTLTDNITRDGCPGVCTLTVPINPPPTCTITGDTPVCESSTHTYTSSVLPAGGTVTHSWTIVGNGTIVGSTTGPSVTVTTGPFASGASFTLTDNISRDGCPGQCVLQVPVTPCAPRICIVKQVACSPPGGVCDGTLTYGETATGVANSDNPAFCYAITVSNCGSSEALNNVTVNDPDLGGALPGFPTTLAIGETVTRYFKKTWGPGTHVNTATTAGVGASSGVRVTTNDTATVVVLQINIECELTLFSSFDMDERPNDGNVTLPAGSTNTPVTMVYTLCNTGTSPLNVTTVSGLPSLDCDGKAIALPLPMVLGAGECRSFTNCISVNCPGDKFEIVARAEADDQGGTLCVYDSSGNRIDDETEKCTATITCETPTTCRVTGGGQLIPGFVDQSCIPVETTIIPFTSPNGLTIKKITHGGQLGAPFSHMDCGERLGNPCIRGQWSHTRHYEGRANPRDVFDMNFHSQTPKGQYDSLLCACLGCCDPATGAFITPITVGEICNPDDHKVCGPQPRPAPANAIIWSGIGKVTPVDDVRGSRAAQAEWVIFRIYIEDRSEPGGGHPGGAVEPADIYCFQAWKTGIKTSKKPDFSSIAATFRASLGRANCAFLESLQSGALPIGSMPSPVVDGLTADIQDCGAMHDGNHQIHPATGATCEE